LISEINIQDKSSTTTLVSNEYIAIINNRINLLNAKLNDVVNQRKVYEQLILSNLDKVFENKIVAYIKDNIKNNKQYNKFKLLSIIDETEKFVLYDNNKINFIKDIIKPKSKSDDNRIIYVYYHSFCKYVVLESNILLEIEKYEPLLLKKKTLTTIFKEYYWEVSKELLKKHIRSYMLPLGLYIKVIFKDRNVARKKYGVKNIKIDWGESYKTLIAITKKVDISIYNKYINKEITRKDLVSLMSKHLYNEKDNPNGYKWLVKNNKDNNLWLVLSRKYVKLNSDNNISIENYGIVPTNFIVNETRSQIDFTNSVSSIEEIIDSKLLGFRDKIRALERFDMNYCLDTFSNEL